MIALGLLGLFIGMIISAILVYFCAILVGIDSVTFGKSFLCAFLSNIIFFVLFLIIAFILALVCLPFNIEPPELLVTSIGFLINFIVIAFCCAAVFQTTVKKGLALSLMLLIVYFLVENFMVPQNNVEETIPPPFPF